MDIGILTQLKNKGKCLDYVVNMGLRVSQLCSWDSAMCTPEVAKTVNEEVKRTGVRIASMWAGYPGPAEWNFTQGPVTLGLIPGRYRRMRVRVLKGWADFAASIGAPAIVTHCGFIPENMTDPVYPKVVDAIAEIAEHCKSRGIGFWFETGQETPVVLLRTIQRVGTGNLGINLDAANLIAYGKGNPIDALDVIGEYVRSIHVKDAFYPTDGDSLGREVQVGQGRVRFPEFMKRLKEIGFTGELIIEREISGEQQLKDMRETIKNLQKWLKD